MEQPEVTLTDDERQPRGIWSRVMSYHRPVSSFNTGKQGEFNERVNFCTRNTEQEIAKP